MSFTRGLAQHVFAFCSSQVKDRSQVESNDK